MSGSFSSSSGGGLGLMDGQMSSVPNRVRKPVNEQQRDAAGEIVRDAFVFDACALRYVLEERYAQPVLDAGVNAVNVAIVLDDDWPAALEKVESCLSRLEDNPIMALATSMSDVERANSDGKLAVLLGTQGTGSVGTRLERLGTLHRMGFTSFGLAYTAANLFADGCGEVRNAGLTFLGRDFVAAVNELPVLLDLSHAGHRAREEAADIAENPVCTHVSAYAVCANDRNVHDDTAVGIVEHGGVLGVCGLPRMVREVEPTVEDYVDHIDHLTKVVGDRAIGLGLDLNEAAQTAKQIPATSRRWRTLRPDLFGTVDDFTQTKHPSQMESITRLPNIVAVMLERGYADNTIRRVLGENWRAAYRRFDASSETEPKGEGNAGLT